MDVFNSILSSVGNIINNVLNFIIMILPDSPFTLLDRTPIADILGYINYFIPIDFMVDTLAAWTAAILIYYCYQIILRWVKAAASA